MAEDNTDGSQNKNVVSGSKFETKGNVHIGDIHNHPSPVIVQPKNSHRPIVYSILILFIVAGAAYWFIYGSGAALLFRKNTVEPGASVVSPQNDVSNSATISPHSNTRPPAEKNTESAESAKTGHTVSSSAERDLKAIRSFLKGPVTKIPGNGATGSFCMNKREVTVGQYLEYCKQTGEKFPYDYITDTSKAELPMRYVTWEEARQYCEFVNGRLPTTAEWTLAATQMIGTDSLLPESEIIKISWTRENSDGRLHPVGKRSTINKVELYDLFGNVEEWCEDGPVNGVKFTAGGYFRSIPAMAKLIEFSHTKEHSRTEILGFRVVFDRCD